MTAALAGPHRFTGVVAGNDLIALGALDALRTAGARCPDDVSLTGFNDMPFVDRLTPPLTTVRLPLEEMGRVAARELLDELTGDSTVPFPPYHPAARRADRAWHHPAGCRADRRASAGLG